MPYASPQSGDDMNVIDRVKTYGSAIGEDVKKFEGYFADDGQGSKVGSELKKDATGLVGVLGSIFKAIQCIFWPSSCDHDSALSHDDMGDVPSGAMVTTHPPGGDKNPIVHAPISAAHESLGDDKHYSSLAALASDYHA